MSSKEIWVENLRSVGVPEKLSNQAADILSRQDAGELPYPLPEPEQHIVSSAWQWYAAKQYQEAES